MAFSFISTLVQYSLRQLLNRLLPIVLTDLGLSAAIQKNSRDNRSAQRSFCILLLKKTGGFALDHHIFCLNPSSQPFV